LKRVHVNQVVHHVIDNNNNVAKDRQQSNVQHVKEEDYAQEEKEMERLRRRLDRSLAFQLPVGAEKHHQKKKNQDRKEKGQNEKGRYQYQYDWYGQQPPRHGRQQQQSSASKQLTDSGNVIRGYDAEDSMAHDVMTTMSKSASASAANHGKREKDYKRVRHSPSAKVMTYANGPQSGKMRNAILEPPQPEPMLLPKGQTTRSLQDRKKHPRLVGADLYVARLGWGKGAPMRKDDSAVRSTIATVQPLYAADGDSNDDDGLSASSAYLQSTSSSSSTGSLHDELLHREPKLQTTPQTKSTAATQSQLIRASRPCYRCISYMHAVGIKRVFWTNDAGEWECGKVRKLVKALDNSMEGVANGTGGPMGNGVFVTKHEVLMLKRMMGEGRA